jgi:hypothetical protein
MLFSILHFILKTLNVSMSDIKAMISWHFANLILSSAETYGPLSGLINLMLSKTPCLFTNEDSLDIKSFAMLLTLFLKHSDGGTMAFSVKNGGLQRHFKSILS